LYNKKFVSCFFKFLYFNNINFFKIRKFKIAFFFFKTIYIIYYYYFKNYSQRKKMLVLRERRYFMGGYVPMVIWKMMQSNFKKFWKVRFSVIFIYLFANSRKTVYNLLNFFYIRKYKTPKILLYFLFKNYKIALRKNFKANKKYNNKQIVKFIRIKVVKNIKYRKKFSIWKIKEFYFILLKKFFWKLKIISFDLTKKKIKCKIKKIYMCIFIHNFFNFITKYKLKKKKKK